jgi:hypothetical protein
MTKLARIGICLGLILFTPALVGCGQRDLSKPSMYPARGRVTIKGQPARYVRVHLEPKDARGAPAIGFTDEDGSFDIRTFAHEGDPDGAVPGEYVVYLSEGVPPKGHTGTKVPTRLQDEEKSGLSIEIKAEDNDIDIQL